MTDDTAEETDGAEPGADAGAAEPSRLERRLARRVRGFAAAHGGGTEGQISYLGARGYRLVLVGADGGWGDVVSPLREPLARAARRAGVTLHDTFDGELAGRLRTGPYEWRRMAGIQLGG